MDIKFNQRADALYIQFQPAEDKVKETIKLRDGLLVDISKDNKLFGIEILDASKRIPSKELSHVNINFPVPR